MKPRALIAIPVALAALGAVWWLRAPREEAPATRPLGGNAWRVSARERDRYLADGARLGRDVVLRPLPPGAKDKIDGLEVAELADGSPLHAAGFRRGDRILRVNGTPVVTLQRATNLVHEVRSNVDLSVQLRRGEETLDYRFEFR